jgi:hypothetical protein
MLQNCYLQSCFFVFFTQGTKNVISHQNFGGWTQNVQMHTGNFLFKLFEFFKILLKCIFIIGAFAPMSQNTMSPLWIT